MTEAAGEICEHATFLVEPTSLGSDFRRYALSMIVVLTLGVGVMATIGHQASGDVASEVDSAVLIDLPPAEMSAAPASNAAEGPEQHAAQASVARDAPDTIEPPKPNDEPKPPTKPEPLDQPPPPVVPDPPAVLERQEAPIPPPPIAAPAVQAQPEHALAGADDPAKTGTSEAAENQPHASKHAITVWQRSLLQQLDKARRLAAREPHATGAVKIEFSINPTGALASEHVLEGSGSGDLDRAALLIIRQASPFAAPPAGSGSRDTLFVLSIRFR